MAAVLVVWWAVTTAGDPTPWHEVVAELAVPVIVAAIAAAGSIVAVILQTQRLRAENTAQHAEGRAFVAALRDDVGRLTGSVGELHGKADTVAATVNDLRDDLNEHLRDHANGGAVVQFRRPG